MAITHIIRENVLGCKDGLVREVREMVTPKFRMEVSFSETTGEPVATYLRVREGKVVETREVSDGAVFADYGADGYLLGIDLLAPCRVEVLDRLAEKEPEPVRRFLHDGTRRPLVVA